MEKNKVSKPVYECSIRFTLSKNLKKVFQERKFLRIVTLNNMVEGKNNIYIIRDTEDIESDIGDLQLECLPVGKSQENNILLHERIKQLESENKALRFRQEKIVKILANN